MTHREDVEKAKQKGIEQFDTTAGMAFDLTVETVREVTQALREAEAVDVEHEGTEWLAEWVAACKALADAAEDARKDHFEPELLDRTDDGEQVGALRKTTGTRRYVTDHAGAFEAVRAAEGDPAEVATVSASKLADVLGENAEAWIGETNYAYFRREQ